MIYSNVQYWAWVLLYSHSAILLLNKALFEFLKYFFDLFWLLKDIHKNITQIKALIYISFIVPSNLQFLSPWCISMRVWSAWWFSGWLNSFASHFLPIYMQVCVCVYCAIYACPLWLLMLFPYIDEIMEMPEWIVFPKLIVIESPWCQVQIWGQANCSQVVCRLYDYITFTVCCFVKLKKLIEVSHGKTYCMVLKQQQSTL